MPNPAPIYIVEYDGDQLPGYVQSDDRPLSARNVSNIAIGMDGSWQSKTGHNRRDITLTFLVKTRLGTGVTDLQHLDDCMDQYREAAAILTRQDGDAELMIHDTDRYYMASFDNITFPLQAGQSRSINYTVKFNAMPWAYSDSEITDTFTGNGDVDLVFAADTRATYPVFSIPGTCTAFTATYGGKTLSFTRGSNSGTIVIDCGNLTVTKLVNDTQALATMGSLNFGLAWTGGTGTMTIPITGFAGSGTVTVSIRSRYEF